MTDNEPKKYTREDYVYLSKLNEKAERYPEMITFIKEMIKMNPKLNKEECDILSTGYKNMITDKRNNWRILNSMLFNASPCHKFTHVAPPDKQNMMSEV